MKPSILLAITLGALTFTGCSSTPAKVDTGAIHARTFSFVSGSAKPYPSYVDKRQAVHSLIQDAITQNLAAKGVQKTAAGGDITVAYLVIVGNNASTEMVDTYFGYGRDTSGLHEKGQSAYSDSKNPNYFEAGTLLIDLIDSQSFKLLKRGYVTRPTLRNVPEDARAAKVQEAVDEIFRDVRIEP